MKRTFRLMVLVIFALFVMPLVFVQSVSAFAENPIPYWDDDSLGVSTTWDSVEQTVTIDEYDIDSDWSASNGYSESFTDVSDWVAKIGDAPTTDGDIGSFTAAGDYSWDQYYSNTPEAILEGYTLYWFAAVNETVDDIYKVYLYDEDSSMGNMVQSSSSIYNTDTDFHLESFLITTSSKIECIRIDIRCNSPITLFLDYLYVGAPELDIGVPLIQQSIQSVEFMGNFSALDSTVRFQMYDSDTGSGLWCDVNSTQVTFPDAAYAEFTEFARINFSLNEEKSIFTIYVSAQNTTLINYYSEYAGLANKDYLRMTDAAFNGSYQLLYFLEEVTDMTDNIFYQLFLSLEFWGYLGPLALVVVGYVLAKKDRGLGLIAFIVQCLFAAQYFALLDATPAYWWHVIIILVGGILTCVVPLIDR